MARTYIGAGMMYYDMDSVIKAFESFQERLQQKEGHMSGMLKERQKQLVDDLTTSFENTVNPSERTKQPPRSNAQSGEVTSAVKKALQEGNVVEATNNGWFLGVGNIDKLDEFPVTVLKSNDEHSIWRILEYGTRKKSWEITPFEQTRLAWYHENGELRFATKVTHPGGLNTIARKFFLMVQTKALEGTYNIARDSFRIIQNMVQKSGFKRRK